MRLTIPLQVIMSCVFIYCPFYSMVDNPWHHKKEPRYDFFVQTAASGPHQLTTLPSPFTLFHQNIPYIGKYATPYETRPNLAIIQFPATSLNKSMKENLKKELNTYIDSKTDITFYMIITGPYIIDASYEEENIIFHPIALHWQKANPPFFASKDYTMGLFDPYNITSAKSNSIPINTCSKISIYPHRPADFSPNNARFSIHNKPFGSFWTIIVDEDKSKAVITYHILLNERELEQIFTKKRLGILEKSKNIQDFFTEIEKQKNSHQLPTKLADACTNFLLEALPERKIDKFSSFLINTTTTLDVLQKSVIY